MNEPIVITREDAIQHGLAPVAIRVHPSAAGLIGRVFPSPGQYLTLSGPPGGAIIVQISDCSQSAADVEQATRASMRSIHMVARDRGVVLGDARDGIVFTTGKGFARVGWFSVLVERADGNVGIACGVSARGDSAVLARDVLEHPSISRALATLELV